ncbi:protein kinase [Gemmata sp. JC673]|uniref:Protein kinase n=1 Tax=Gemmata algarum TaxID=2975278 RepID=A0ABU5EWG4_9BACT|nr:tubulin-like doman-containing protein [Gemmata algarum]MDY3559638.1 protein kinase [Gemmata algarum]
MSVRFEAQVEPISGYKLLDRLGAGGFGEVWRCEAPGGIFKAIKIIHGDLRSRDNDLVRYAEQELKSLKRVQQVRHPYLLALDRYDIVDGRLMIVMELADCNLWDRFRECRDRGLPGIPRDELLQYMTEIAEVLDLFNDQFQLQHLDIKPQNLFLLYNHVKVADFGQVKDLQGLMAEVTGGITPVYAAPETFDGVITRYCDQYSLACVYQELLTGVRPFDGSSMSQLLMQHLNLPPNLTPSPPNDRPALARALSKKPEDRWPNVASLVRSLAGAPAPSGVFPKYPAADNDTPTMIGLPPNIAPPGAAAAAALVSVADDTPSRGGEIYGPVFTPAPPELGGDGPLQPAIVIGLGNAGLRVIQRLRFELHERYGPPATTPALRTLYIDTDPDGLEEAGRERFSDRLAALSSDEVFPARLNRAGHYLKPRFNGRSLTEGWFDPQLLYKLPRNPLTLGVRLFGRLAFLDHYRFIMAKVQAEIDAAVAPDALLLTEARTGLKRRTNRPRVYVVAGTGGGTGGGMFLDLAYAVRSRLKRMGYDRPDVRGLMVVPPADATLTPPQALGNTYAALTELNHYSRPDTVFTAHYDERSGFVKETDAPFARCYLLPGPAAGPSSPPGSGVSPVARRTPANIPNPGARPRPGSGAANKPGSRVISLAAQRTPDPSAALSALRPFGDAAERIRLDLFAQVGRAADEARAAEEHDRDERPRGVTVGAFGIATFDWPRAEVVSRTAATVGRALLKRWAAPDLKRVREQMPGIAAQRWTQLGLDPDTILGHLQFAAEQAAGGKIDERAAAATEPLVPRGWLNRLPEPTQVGVALDTINRLLGPPAAALKRPLTALEEAVAKVAADAAAAFALDLRTLAPVLVDDAEFRLAGTEELFRQFLATTDRLIERYTQLAAELDAKAVSGFECLSHYAHYQRGMWKPSAAELTDALRLYPRARFQAVTFRQLVGAYQTVRDTLSEQVADVAVARQRMAAAAASVPEEPPEPPVSLRRLMPAGCVSLGDAVDRFLKVLTDADLAEIDRRVQSVLEPETGGLFQVCLNSSAGVEGVIAVVFEETRLHLDRRLGEVGLAAMFAERFRTPQQAERAIEQAYQEAEPAWVGNGPWAGSEVTVLACPAGASGEALRELARRAIPVAGLPIAESRDDLTIYREWASVPLAALPHLGPAAADAYRTIPEVAQCSAHARLDVTAWLDVDAP